MTGVVLVALLATVPIDRATHVMRDLIARFDSGKFGPFELGKPLSIPGSGEWKCKISYGENWGCFSATKGLRVYETTWRDLISEIGVSTSDDYEPKSKVCPSFHWLVQEMDRLLGPSKHLAHACVVKPHGWPTCAFWKKNGLVLELLVNPLVEDISRASFSAQITAERDFRSFCRDPWYGPPGW